MAKGRAATAKRSRAARCPPPAPWCVGTRGHSSDFVCKDLPLAAFQGAGRALSGEERGQE